MGTAWLIDKGFTAYQAYEDIQALRDGTKTLDQLIAEKGEDYILQVIAGNVGKKDRRLQFRLALFAGGRSVEAFT